MAEGPLKILDPDEVSEVLELQARQRAWGRHMQEWFEIEQAMGYTEAATKEEFYGFQTSDIVQAHLWKGGCGAGVFYRLRNGRVIDSLGRPQDPDPNLYDKLLN